MRLPPTENKPLGPASTRLTPRLLGMIIHQIDRPSTLAVVMRVSRMMYALAAPRLYCEVVVTHSNARSLFLGSSQHPSIRLAPKYQLISTIRHLIIYKIPPKDVCGYLVRLAEQNMIPRQTPITITFHPKAIWRLMDYHMVKNERAHAIPHPFLIYLQSLDVKHLCIQMPVMDRRLEESLFSSRARRSDAISWEIARQQLRDALTSPPHINTYYSKYRFFDLFMIPSQRVTIHNLTLASCDRVVRSLNQRTTDVRIYLRPCAGVDGELFDEVADHFCYNHPISGNIDLISGEFRLSREILDAPQHIEFVDIDWLRGKYDGLRNEEDLELIKAQVEHQIEEGTSAERKIWRRKSFVTSSQIEGCVCCGRSQLSAREVYRSIF